MIVNSLLERVSKKDFTTDYEVRAEGKKVGFVNHQNKYGAYKVLGRSTKASHHFAIMFLEDNPNKEIVWAHRASMARCTVTNPYKPTVVGVGYRGTGDYSITDGTGNKTLAYVTWLDMILRVTDPNKEKKFRAYKDVTIAPEWYNFQNFAEWFYANHVDGWVLDKDIENAKQYGPTTCHFIPNWLNHFIMSFELRPMSSTGYRGVSQSPSGRFTARVHDFTQDRYVHLGTFEEAHLAHIAFLQKREELLDKAKERALEEGLSFDIVMKLNNNIYER